VPKKKEVIKNSIKKTVKKAVKKEKRGEDLAISINAVVDILQSGENKKFNVLQLFKALKIDGKVKSINEVLVKLRSLRALKKYEVLGPNTWYRV